MGWDGLPLWLSGLLLVGLPTLLAMAGTVWVRRVIPLERLRSNNEVAGFTFATVGVLYAVLLAFAVIVVWEKFSDAEEGVAREAAAAAILFRLVEGVDSELKPELRKRLTAYLQTAITRDWEAMARGRSSPETTRALADVYTVVLSHKPTDFRGAAAMTEILRQLDAMTQARRERVVHSGGTVPNVLWFVLFGGAVITIGFAFFFGTKSVLAQTLMNGALALMVFSSLVVVLAIDQPFSGAVTVDPEPLIEVLEELSGVRFAR